MGIIAAVVFVTLLGGSLSVALAAARQNGLRTSGPPRRFEALSSIQMPDPRAGWAVTAKGHVIRTADGGVHWKNVTPHYPAAAGRRKVVADFFTVSSAWVAVSQTAAGGTTAVVVFRTTDGGRTWRETTIQQSSTIYQIAFMEGLQRTSAIKSSLILSVMDPSSDYACNRYDYVCSQGAERRMNGAERVRGVPLAGRFC